MPYPKGKTYPKKMTFVMTEEEHRELMADINNHDTSICEGMRRIVREYLKSKP